MDLAQFLQLCQCKICSPEHVLPSLIVTTYPAVLHRVVKQLVHQPLYPGHR